MNALDMNKQFLSVSQDPHSSDAQRNRTR